MRYVFAVYVENKYGVLARVSGLFMRKGFNIDSLTVSETDDPGFSRITITMKGDDYAREQLINQLRKLHNVKQVELLDNEGAIEQELLLIKVKNTPENRSELMAAAGIFGAQVIDYSIEAMCVKVTGEPKEINAFIELMRHLGILELCRTGVVALERGAGTLKQHKY